MNKEKTVKKTETKNGEDKTHTVHFVQGIVRNSQQQRKRISKEAHARLCSYRIGEVDVEQKHKVILDEGYQFFL